jgi:hypothetical protein
MHYHAECDLNHALSHLSAKLQERETTIANIRKAIATASASDGSAMVKAVAGMLATDASTATGGSFSRQLFLIVQAHPDDDLVSLQSGLKADLAAALAKAGDLSLASLTTSLTSDADDWKKEIVIAWLKRIPAREFGKLAPAPAKVAKASSKTRATQPSSANPATAKVKAAFAEIATASLADEFKDRRDRRLAVLRPIASNVQDKSELAKELQNAAAASKDPVLVASGKALEAARGDPKKSADDLRADVLDAFIEALPRL